MIELIRKILLKLIFVLDNFHKSKDGTQQETTKAIKVARVIGWIKDNGDETLRLNYPLNENSLVFDIGGYKGEFARDIYCKYNSNIFIFEPVTQFCEEIKLRFVNNSKINVYNFGLGNSNFKAQINVEDDSSSLFIKGTKAIEIEIQSFNDFIREHIIESIDLVKINIEGSEYDLLESILEAGNISKIQNIQVQFHDFIIENAIERMKSIQEKLAKTHQLTYQYEFVWENWRLKNE